MKRPIAGSSTLTSRQPYVACRKLADRGRSKKFVGRVRIDDPPRRLFASISVAGAKVNAARHTGQNLQTTWYNKPMPLHDCAPRPAHIKRSEEHTSELQSQSNLVCRLLLEKKKKKKKKNIINNNTMLTVKRNIS